MKRIKNLAILTLLVALFASAGCDSFLEPDVYSDLAPENFLDTQEGLESLLYSAYGELMWGFGETKYRTLHASDWTTDIGWQTGGGENRAASLMINYTWDPANNVALMYNKPFDAVRNANTLLENIDDADVPDGLKTQLRAEGRFIRAMAYYDMYGWLGPVPLRTSTEDPQEMARATEQEMQTFIEDELLAAAADLPMDPVVYGRATKGAARGVLTKFYLNTEQWQKAADMAQTIMTEHNYSLVDDYFELFQAENERNSEFMWVDTAVPDGPGNAHMNGTFPPGFRKHPRTGLEWQSNWNNWASQYRLRDNFFESFEEGDERMDLIVREYVNAAGDTVSLLGADNTRAFKYWPDPNAIGNQHGNDLPRVRYADILLTRAEALVHTQGLNQESIDLLNQVRERADLAPMALGDFSSQEAFLDHLLQERAWEFYAEGLRREDLIRHGKLIDGVITLTDGTTIPVGAHNRGIDNARDCHVRFPLPQNAMDANPALEQNECYR